MMRVVDEGPCGNCGHAFDEHATDVSFPEVQRCFHGAATGVGCTPEYKDRCKQYVPKRENS